MFPSDLCSDPGLQLDLNENVSQHTRILRKEEEEKIVRHSPSFLCVCCLPSSAPRPVLIQMNQKLKEMKEMYATRMKQVKAREDAFLAEQRARIRQLRKAKEQIVETDTKRARAEKKAQDETAQAVKKALEKQELMKQLQEAEERVKKDQKKLGELQAPHKC